MPWTDRGNKTVNPGVVNAIVLSVTNMTGFFIQVNGQTSENVRKYGDIWIVASASPLGTPMGVVYDYFPLWRPYSFFRLPVGYNVAGFEFKSNKAFQTAVTWRLSTFTP